MAISSRQIGWSTKANLLWTISKQVEALTGVMGRNIPATTTTTTTAAPSYVYSSTAGNIDACVSCIDASFPYSFFNNTGGIPALGDVFYNDNQLTSLVVGDNKWYNLYLVNESVQINNSGVIIDVYLCADCP